MERERRRGERGGMKNSFQHNIRNKAYLRLIREEVKSQCSKEMYSPWRKTGSDLSAGVTERERMNG